MKENISFTHPRFPPLKYFHSLVEVRGQRYFLNAEFSISVRFLRLHPACRHAGMRQRLIELLRSDVGTMRSSAAAH